MRSLGLLAIICGLLSGCAVLRKPVNANETAKLANAHPEDLPLNRNAPTYAVVEEDVVEIPVSESRGNRATASTGTTMVEPSQRKSAATEPGTSQRQLQLPGTARVPAAPIFARSTVPIGQYKLDQGLDEEALETKMRILDAMAQAPMLPNDGAAVTVITRGDKAVLFGTLSNEQRALVEEIARENAKRVESHIVLMKP